MNPAARCPGGWSLRLAVIFLWFAAIAWIRPLTGPDEGRYIGVALDMLQSGDWMVPRLNGFPFFHKPPLFYWISAASMSTFGLHEWAGRMPSILGATLAAFSLHAFVRRWAGRPAARYSVAVLASMPFFYIGAQFANLDMLVAGCITATILMAAHSELLREREFPAGGARLAAFALAALGVLAKGLIGLVLPAAVLLLWCLLGRRSWRALRPWLSPAGWCIFLLIALPWPIAMQMQFPDFLDYFVVTQHFRRFAQTGFNNAHPFWFYMPVIAALTLPWFALVPAGFRTAWQERRSLSEIDGLMACWLFVIVGFFSVPQSKLVGYVLPAVPPLAYFIGCIFFRWNRPDRMKKMVAAAALVCLASVLLTARFATAPASRLPLPDGAAIGPQDKVVMLDDYFYELPFYWRFAQRSHIASDWTPSVAQEKDNWRKAMFDAAQFAPLAERRRLIAPADIDALRCTPGVTWLIASAQSTAVARWVGGAEPVVGNRRVAAWKLAPADPASSACRQAAAAP